MTDQELKDLVASLALRHQDLVGAQLKTDQLLQETDRQMQETDRRLKEIRESAERDTRELNRFEVGGNTVRIVREESRSGSRGQRLLDRMRGRATSGLSTEEIMTLTRGES